MAERYNGWRNYETWLAKLWMDNEESTQGYWLEVAQSIWETSDPDVTFTRSDKARFVLADAMKESFENDFPLPEAGFFTDLLNSALGEVDWREIADAYLEENDGYESLR